jgi:hypothetical protein
MTKYCFDSLKATLLLLLVHSSWSFVPQSTTNRDPKFSTLRYLNKNRPVQNHDRLLSFTKRYVTGADIEQPPTDEESSSESPAVPEATAAPSRGKVNEIDFCIAPADVSLSRSYSSSSSNTGPTAAATPAPVLSLTRALNNASNRAVRRILLARAWPSAEALNKSFRQAAAMEKEREAAMAKDNTSNSKSGAKCPVPRPILNLIMRRRSSSTSSSDPGETTPTKSFDAKVAKEGKPTPRSRTDKEYVADQLKSFRERYGQLPGYSFAEAYLESILSLATSGKESPRVKEVSYFFLV